MKLMDVVVVMDDEEIGYVVVESGGWFYMILVDVSSGIDCVVIVVESWLDIDILVNV